MSRICVITADGGAYYAIVSRLRDAELPFLSLLPSDADIECGLVITTKSEGFSFGSPTLSLEDLDENPDVARGQILSKLSEERRRCWSALTRAPESGRRLSWERSP